MFHILAYNEEAEEANGLQAMNPDYLGWEGAV
jgi:hypothetical protein